MQEEQVAREKDLPRQLALTEKDAHDDAFEFFETAKDCIDKHFKLWTCGELLTYAFAGDSFVASALARWTKDGTLPAINESYSSERHECNINLHDFIAYCAKSSTPEEIQNTVLVQGHSLAIDALANGESLWSNTTNTEVKRLAKWCKRHIVPHMSSTHRVEACIREASLCAPSGRTEDLRSAMVLLRSTLNSTVNRLTREECEEKVRRGNAHMDAGVKGECKLISDASKRKRKAEDEGEADAKKMSSTPRGAIRAKHLLEVTRARHQSSNKPEI